MLLNNVRIKYEIIHYKLLIIMCLNQKADYSSDNANLNIENYGHVYSTAVLYVMHELCFAMREISVNNNEFKKLIHVFDNTVYIF